MTTSASWRDRLRGRRRPTRVSVSVVMATFNGGRYLGEQLDCLSRQTRRPDELVVRDDGSTDDTVALLNGFRDSAGFAVRLLDGGERLGYARNFMTAADASTGDLLFFCDQDDIWRPGKIERIVQALTGSGGEACFHDFALHSVRAQGSDGADSYYALLQARGFSRAVAFKGCSMTVTAAFLRRWGWPPPESGISHDFWVALLSTAYGTRRYVAEVLVDHRLHDGNASGWVAGDNDRVFTRPGEPVPDVELMIDLVIKGERVEPWTAALLAALDGPGAQGRPRETHSLRAALVANADRHRRAG